MVAITHNRSWASVTNAYLVVPCRIYSHQLVSSRESFASSRGQSDPTEYPESLQIVTHRWRSQHIATDRAICLYLDQHDLETL